MASNILEYKCPHCGGKMNFNVVSQKMQCPYCDSVMSVKEFRELDEALNETKNDEDEEIGFEDEDFDLESDATSDSEADEWSMFEGNRTQTFICKSCGGEIVGDKTLAATQCPYCGNNVVFAERLQGMLRPQFIIPFKKTKEDAKNIYKDFVKRKMYLSGKFKKHAVIDKITGIYVPFWLFDANPSAEAKFTGEKVNTWISGNYQYTRTEIWNIERAGRMMFKNIPIDGSTKIPDDLIQSVEPYDFNDRENFQTAYLSGFFADKYDIDFETCAEHADKRLGEVILDALKSTASGYTAIQRVSDTTDRCHVFKEREKVKYVLYPVYIVAVQYHGKPYTFAINGQTGKIAGNLPTSILRRILFVACLFLVSMYAMVLLFRLGGSLLR